MNEQEYRDTLRRIDALFFAPLNAAQELRFRQWVDEVCKYEDEHYPTPECAFLWVKRAWWRLRGW